VDSPTVAGRYLVERVLLNRAQLILERRLHAMLSSIDDFDDWVGASLPMMTPQEMRATVAVLRKISKVKTGALIARPYNDPDTRKAVKSKGARKRSQS
jgi:hypothetical protein